MLVKVDIFDNPSDNKLNRARGRVLIMAPSGNYAGELDVREASFDADVVNSIPQEAYDSDGAIDLDELATISESKLEDLMGSIKYLGNPDED